MNIEQVTNQRVRVGLAILLVSMVTIMIRMQCHTQSVVRQIDRSTIHLTEREKKTLYELNGLVPVLSRGATIFLDLETSIRVPPSNIVERMSFRDLEEFYYRYVSSIQYPCKRQIYLGPIAGVGHFVCQDDDFAPHPPCFVYSFRKADFSFECELHEEFGCEVHCFDPSNRMNEHQHSTAVFFHPFGLGNEHDAINRKGSIRKFSAIRNDLIHNNLPIEFLKIDLNGAEWTALRNLTDDSHLAGVKQMIVVFHSLVFNTEVTRTHTQYQYYLNLLRDIYDEGFRIFHFKTKDDGECLFTDEFGIQRSGCQEVMFLRLKRNTKVNSY